MFNDIFKNGSQHYHFIFIIALQYAIDVPPAIRNTVSYIAIFRETNEDALTKLYKNYGGACNTKEIFKELNYQDNHAKTVLVLETDKVPPNEVIEKVARDTQMPAKDLTFILTPTRSIAGTVQITARVLEVALHKLHTLHFPLDQLVDGYGVAPIPAPSPDFLTGMGRTNDAILFGGFVHLYVKCSDDAAKKLAAELPSSASKDYGRPFAEVFKAVNMDFYQIDPLLFSPAKVTVTNLETGHSFFGGGFNAALLDQSFN